MFLYILKEFINIILTYESYVLYQFLSKKYWKHLGKALHTWHWQEYYEWDRPFLYIEFSYKKYIYNCTHSNILHTVKVDYKDMCLNI